MLRTTAVQRRMTITVAEGDGAEGWERWGGWIPTPSEAQPSALTKQAQITARDKGGAALDEADDFVAQR